MKAFKNTVTKLVSDRQVGFTDAIKVLSPRVKDDILGVFETRQLNVFKARASRFMDSTTKEIFSEVVSSSKPLSVFINRFLPRANPSDLSFTNTTTSTTHQLSYRKGAPNGEFEDTMQQGWVLGTCTVLAALPLVRVSANDNGTYSVKFNDGWITVTNDVLSGNLGASFDDDAALVEKAYAIKRGGWGSIGNGNAIPKVMSDFGYGVKQGLVEGAVATIVATYKPNQYVPESHALRVTANVNGVISLDNPWGNSWDTSAPTKDVLAFEDVYSAVRLG
jgi:hypothetical protein